MADAVLGGGLAGFVEFAADQGDNLDAVDVFDAVQVLEAEMPVPGVGTARSNCLQKIANPQCK
jgi:hypothetical protein